MNNEPNEPTDEEIEGMLIEVETELPYIVELFNGEGTIKLSEKDYAELKEAERVAEGFNSLGHVVRILAVYEDWGKLYIPEQGVIEGPQGTLTFG